MKVLSFKVSDEIYDFIDSLPETHTIILRKSLELYLSTLKESDLKKSIPVVYQKNDIDQYKMVRKEVNGFLKHLKKDK